MNYNTDLQQKLASSSSHGSAILGTGALPQQESMQSDRPGTEIEGCLNRANGALERLHGRISAVEDRVQPVMRAVGTGQCGSTVKPQAALSPLGDAITSIESRIDSAVDRLEALLLGLAL